MRRLNTTRLMSIALFLYLMARMVAMQSVEYLVLAGLLGIMAQLLDDYYNAESDRIREETEKQEREEQEELDRIRNEWNRRIQEQKNARIQRDKTFEEIMEIQRNGLD